MEYNSMSTSELRELLKSEEQEYALYRRASGADLDWHWPSGAKARASSAPDRIRAIKAELETRRLSES